MGPLGPGDKRETQGEKWRVYHVSKGEKVTSLMRSQADPGHSYRWAVENVTEQLKFRAGRR